MIGPLVVVTVGALAAVTLVFTTMNNHNNGTSQKDGYIASVVEYKPLEISFGDFKKDPMKYITSNLDVYAEMIKNAHSQVGKSNCDSEILIFVFAFRVRI